GAGAFASLARASSKGWSRHLAEYPPMRVLLSGLAVLALAACSDSDRPPTAATLEGAAYAVPPRVTAVRADGHGGLVVEGRAEPDERVRLIEMDGSAHGAEAEADGRFTVPAPGGAGQDRLLAVDVQRAGRSVAS